MLPGWRLLSFIVYYVVTWIATWSISVYLICRTNSLHHPESLSSLYTLFHFFRISMPHIWSLKADIPHMQYICTYATLWYPRIFWYTPLPDLFSSGKPAWVVKFRIQPSDMHESLHGATSRDSRECELDGSILKTHGYLFIWKHTNRLPQCSIRILRIWNLGLIFSIELSAFPILR